MTCRLRKMNEISSSIVFLLFLKPKCIQNAVFFWNEISILKKKHKGWNIYHILRYPFIPKQLGIRQWFDSSIRNLSGHLIETLATWRIIPLSKWSVTMPEAPKSTKKSVRYIFVRFLFFCSTASLQKKSVRFFFLADVLCIKSNPVGSITYGSGLNIFVLF